MSVRIETHGHAIHVTLDSPTTRNALTDEMVDVLRHALVQARRQPNVRAIVLCGAGGNFCAGGDFGRFKVWMTTPSPRDIDDPIARHNRALGALMEQWVDADVATIGVVEGAAHGAGVGLAACCDVVLAASDSTFAMPDVTIGMPPAQVAPFIVARVGHGVALRWMLTGRSIDAHQALAAGLVDEVCAPDMLHDRLRRWLDDLSHAEPAALRATKAIVRHRRNQPLSSTLDYAAQAFASALRSGTAAEGIAAFDEKRPPRWVTK
ncbi:MAG TPA: enoyl-CoA hydratase/isomerase family protein [Burkholderiaceae bacterium]|nr:enoyl-CoA hydratase/isomerase family protein [Burkholderiaceae bacterium]